MFNFKKKFSQLVQPKVDTNVLVAQIHSDFDTATERLLNEAKSMFIEPNKEKVIYRKILENDLVIVYTKTQEK